MKHEFLLPLKDQDQTHGNVIHKAKRCEYIESNFKEVSKREVRFDCIIKLCDF